MEESVKIRKVTTPNLDHYIISEPMIKEEVIDSQQRFFLIGQVNNSSRNSLLLQNNLLLEQISKVL